MTDYRHFLMLTPLLRPQSTVFHWYLPNLVAASPHVVKELCNLQEQIRDLRFMIQNKLDAMERSVTGAQRYINNLIPWTTEVHQTLTDFMSGALTGQEKGGDRKKFRVIGVLFCDDAVSQ